MEWISFGDVRAVKYIRKKELNQEAYYRLCSYTYLFSEKGKHLVQNMLSGQIVRLNEQEWAALEQIREGQKRYAFLEEHGLTELALARVLVETDWDEMEQYFLMVQVLRSLSREKPGVKSYTILPTTGCNARCVYCFEEGIAVKTMTAATADRTADYIAKTRWEDTVFFQWFGGEPLCAPGIISRICRRLTERGIQFRSKITTNGTLLTPAMADEAKEIWHLEEAQLSLDGAREDYDKRKAFPHPDGTEYDRALAAAEYLLDRGIRVTLRLNFDAENLPRLYSFCEEMKQRFGGRGDAFRIYPALLQQTRFLEDLIAINKERDKLVQYLGEKELLGSKMNEKPFRLPLHQCMADSMGKHVVIDPEGTVFNCDNLPGPLPRGSIFNDDVPMDGADCFMTMAAECRHCCFLPMCTPHYRSSCPLWFEGCFKIACQRTDDQLRKLISGHAKELPFIHNC